MQQRRQSFGGWALVARRQADAQQASMHKSCGQRMGAC
jgi:hypothetical protein